MAIVHNFREVLLGSTSHPYLVVASLREFGDNLLEVEITVTLLVDELAHLIGKENKTIVIALIFQIGSQFHTEAVDAHIGVSLDDAFTNAIYRKGRGKLFSNIQYPIQLVVNQVSSHTWVIPVATFLSDALLEGFEHAFLGKRLFQVLCQGDIELIEATLAVELIPEYVKESLLLVCRVVVAGFQVEDAGVDGGTLQPIGDGKQLVVIETEVVLLVERVDGFYCFQKSVYGSLAGSRSNTVVEVFQEVRFTRTIVTVNPDTYMVVWFVVLDGIEYAEETIDNLIRKHVFLYFYSFCLWVKLGSTDGRIDSTVDWLAI